MFSDYKTEFYPKIDNLSWMQFKAAFLRLKYALGVDEPFDFISTIRRGNVLLVGEGNLSFSNSLSTRVGLVSKTITATTFDPESGWSTSTLHNARRIRSRGARVFGGIDATQLNRVFPKQSFSLVVFQFPNVASRQPIYGRNPNHILIRRFLRSAVSCLTRDGCIAITAVNSPHYDGPFDMDDAAHRAGLEKPVAYPFYFKDHPGYSHVNTNEQEQSAVAKVVEFVTFVFNSRGGK